MFSRHMKPYKKALARRMRANPTPAERELWKHLRESGLKFRRQACCAGYILDFYCPSRRLAVEVDGPCHSQKEARDWVRDGHLLRYGISTMRFSNEEVLRDPASVVAKIQRKADSSRDFASWNAGLRYRRFRF
jgi:very-short-patch-repair endonuclease